MTTVLALSVAQTVFAVALGTITLIIAAFAVYVVSSTMWGNRWIRKPR